MQSLRLLRTWHVFRILNRYCVILFNGILLYGLTLWLFARGGRLSPPSISLVLLAQGCHVFRTLVRSKRPKVSLRFELANFVRGVRLDTLIILVLVWARGKCLNGIKLLLVLIEIFLVVSLQKLLIDLRGLLLLRRIQSRSILLLVWVNNLWEISLSSYLVVLTYLLWGLILGIFWQLIQTASRGTKNLRLPEILWLIL